MHPALSAGFAALALVAGAVQAQTTADCTRQFEDESQRIQRDLARQVPPQGDRDAQQRWSRILHDQLEAASRRADDCRRAAERRANPQAASKEQACAATAQRQAEVLRQRYGNRTLTPAEQSTLRADEAALMDARNDCLLKARRG